MRWRNIGKYRNRYGKVVVVIYDLYDVVDYDFGVHNGWIEKPMHALYTDV